MNLIWSGRLPLAAWYAVIGTPIAVSYGFVHWQPCQQTIYHLLAFAAPLALLFGIRRHRPPAKAPWYLIVVGATFSATADVVFDAYGWLGRATPFPSFADPMYIIGELLLAAGILILSVRAGRGPVRWLLDWAVVGVAGSLLLYVTIIAPVIDTPGTVVQRAIAAAYPSLDVVLLLAIVPLVLVRTRNAALLAVLGYAVFTLAGDAVYGRQLLNGTYVSGSWLDVLWLLSFVALGAVGMMRSLTRSHGPAARGWDDWTRLVVLGLATGVVFVLVAMSRPGGGDEFLISVAMGAVVLALVFGRLALLHAERRAAAVLLTREARRLDAFEEVQRAIAEDDLELDDLLRLVCDQTVSLLGGGAVVSLAAGGDLLVRASSGTTAAAPGTTLSERSLAGMTVETDAMLICADVDLDDRVDLKLSHASGIRSLAAAPVRFGGSAVGAITATSSELGRFDSRVGRTLQLMATLVSDAISRSSEFAVRCALEAMLESSDDAIIGMSLESTVLSWNAGAAQMFGYSEHEIIGKPKAVLMPPGVPSDLDEFRERLARGESIAPYETERLTKDGRRIIVSLGLWPTRDFGGRVVGASAIARDITDQRRLEAELHQSQKLEAIGRLAGGIAHDFNNLLMAIQGYGSLALARVGHDETSRHYMEQVLTASRQSADLTQQLLAYSRKQVLQPTVVDPNDVIREIKGMLERVIGETIEIVCELDSDVGTVLVDRSRLAQVVMNLCVNARDAMSGAGRLLVRTEAVTVAPGGSRAAGGAPPGSYARLTVRDTGIGMDAATLDQIFDPFFTTKAVGEGTGLGLASVQGTVSQSGGFIAVESEPGHGTAFEIYLPELAATALVPDAQPYLEPASSAGAGRVLLVEDMPAVREIVCEMLCHAGYEVTPAASGAEALALAEHEEFDLLFTDIVMPGISGVELARALRARQPSLGVVFTSGYPDDRVEAAEPIRNSVFLQKPYSPIDLRVATLSALVDHPVGWEASENSRNSPVTR